VTWNVAHPLLFEIARESIAIRLPKRRLRISSGSGAGSRGDDLGVGFSS
jgi:hypothetical protein